MRPILSIGFFGGILSLGACNWTRFDDLKDDTWVDSTKKPDVKSSDWGVALAVASPSDADSFAGAVTVIGTGVPTYSILDYSPDGKSKLEASISLVTAGNVENLDSTPVMLNDYAAGHSYVVGSTGPTQVAYFDINGQGVQVFGPADASGGATFVHEASGMHGVIVGNSTKVYSELGPDNNCDVGVTVAGLGTVASATAGDDLVVVWDSTGGLSLFPSSLYEGLNCTALGTALATGFAMPTGVSMTPISADSFLLQGHTASGGGSYLGVFTVDPATNTIAQVGQAITADGLKSATVLATSAMGTFAVAGYPAVVVDNKTAGQVLAYEITLDGTGVPTALDQDPTMTLADAQPDNDESFGRAVTVMPFRGENVLVVGADNEVFSYFQSMLYSETREGK
ncbi:MAG TPA: hypothetical protein VGM88_03100 [Kofleriaceae bacterium]|jgi:hypothetical protein